MRNIRKVIILVLIAIILTFISLFSLYNTIKEPDQADLEYILKNHEEEFSYIGEYLLKSTSNYIRWDSIESNTIQFYNDTSDMTFLDTELNINLTSNKKLVNSINCIKKEGFKNIIKIDSHIEFIRWSSLDISCGLVYSKSKKIKIMEYGKTELIPLKMPNWYYYRNVS